MAAKRTECPNVLLIGTTTSRVQVVRCQRGSKHEHRVNHIDGDPQHYATLQFNRTELDLTWTWIPKKHKEGT